MMLAVMRRLLAAAARAIREPSYLVRRISWSAYERLPERVLTLDTHHGRMSLRSHDQVIGRLLFVNRAFCIVDVEAVAAIIARERPDAAQRVLIDAGANIGTVCIPLVRRQAFARALAFEPDPANFELLERNIRQNVPAGAIRPFRCGLSSEDGAGLLWRSDYNYGDNRLHAHGLTVDHGGAVPVALRRLDAILSEQGLNADAIGMLWMDTQGHELELLRGAMSLLAARVPILLEFSPALLRDAGSDPEELLGLLRVHYERFYDVNAGTALRPARELTLEGLRLPDGSFTDLLVL